MDAIILKNVNIEMFNKLSNWFNKEFEEELSNKEKSFFKDIRRYIHFGAITNGNYQLIKFDEKFDKLGWAIQREFILRLIP